MKSWQPSLRLNAPNSLNPRRAVATALAIALLAQPVSARAVSDEAAGAEHESNLIAKLSGITHVFPSVEIGGGESLGIEKQALESQVLRELRLAGVPLIPETDLIQLKKGTAALHVSVNVVADPPSGLVAYTVRARCLRPVLVDGSPLVALATVWEVGVVRLDARAKARVGSANAMRAQVKEFVRKLRGAARKVSEPGALQGSPL